MAITELVVKIDTYLNYIFNNVNSNILKDFLEIE